MDNKFNRKYTKQEEILKNLPFFKYHPNPLETGAFTVNDEPVVCDCCGEKTLISYGGPFYALDSIDDLCPECIASGRAAEKFDGEFQDEYSTDEVTDRTKTDELIHRTPGYCGWQQEYWRAHCNDYCAYLGGVGTKELNQMGILEEVLDDSNLSEDIKNWVRDGLLVNNGSMQGYLFKCLHCGRHLLCIDFD